jgi:hypothetical protein
MNSQRLGRKLFLGAAGLCILAAIIFTGKNVIFSQPTQPDQISISTATTTPVQVNIKPTYVRGIHITAWIAGSAKGRAYCDTLFKETEINTAVIDVKEYEGEVYVPGFTQAQEFGTYVAAMPDLEKYLARLKAEGIYTIARVVVFKDALLPNKKPKWAVKNPDGTVWKDHRGLTWVDPYNKDVWDYNISIAEKSVKLGFDEIQFDYIRFPSDGNTKACRYSVKHTSVSAPAALDGFLELAGQRLGKLGAKVGIDVFGLTTTVSNDMGIGQKIVQMAQRVDYVSPMVYPSHYNPGEYGIANPNASPYKIVYLGMEGAKKRIPIEKLRPYLQDFSLGVRYGAKEVRAQIQACYDNGIGEWILWNSKCVYSRGGLLAKSETNIMNSNTEEEVTKLLNRAKPIINKSTTTSTQQ